MDWYQAKPSFYFLDIAYLNLANAFVIAGARDQALHYRLRWFQLGETLDDYWIACEALESIAALDPPQAITLCKQQILQYRERQVLPGVAALLHTLGISFTLAGDRFEALAALQESLTLWQQLDDFGSEWRNQARACLELGLVSYLWQDYRQALVYAKESVQLYEKTTNWHGVAMARIAIGYPALAVNNLPLALSSFHEALQVTMGRDLDCTYLALVGLAEIAKRQTNLRLAAHLFGAAEQFTQQINLVDHRWKEAYCQSMFTAAYRQLRSDTYAAIWTEGQTMPVEQVMQVALTFM